MKIIPYGGQLLRFLAEPLDGFAVAEVDVPARFGGPIPHVHHGFDEGLYVLEGTLLVTSGHDEPVEAPAGTYFQAARGVRHTFANPGSRPARVLGLWSPGPAGVAFMADVGAALPTAGRPDPAVMAEIYRRHASDLQP